jgi:hypothetical protein
VAQICSGGNTGKISNASKDCDGNCFGPFTMDLSSYCTCHLNSTAPNATNATGEFCMTALCVFKRACDVILVLIQQLMMYGHLATLILVGCLTPSPSPKLTNIAFRRAMGCPPVRTVSSCSLHKQKDLSRFHICSHSFSSCCSCRRCGDYWHDQLDSVICEGHGISFLTRDFLLHLWRVSTLLLLGS